MFYFCVRRLVSCTQHLNRSREYNPWTECRIRGRWIFKRGFVDRGDGLIDVRVAFNSCRIEAATKWMEHRTPCGIGQDYRIGIGCWRTRRTTFTRGPSPVVHQEYAWRKAAGVHCGVEAPTDARKVWSAGVTHGAVRIAATATIRIARAGVARRTSRRRSRSWQTRVRVSELEELLFTRIAIIAEEDTRHTATIVASACVAFGIA